MSGMDDSRKRTIVINLYGGPGTGKSTTAAEAFAKLKHMGINAELSTEYAKDVVWEGRDYLLSDQIYLFAKQNRKLARLYGKVDIIVTDSPLYLSYYYSKNPHILGLIREESQRAENVHVFLIRKKAYNPKGRYQTEDEAKSIDKGIRDMPDAEGIKYREVIADDKAADQIVGLIKEWF